MRLSMRKKSERDVIVFFKSTKNQQMRFTGFSINVSLEPTNKIF